VTASTMAVITTVPITSRMPPAAIMARSGILPEP